MFNLKAKQAKTNSKKAHFSFAFSSHIIVYC